MNYVLNYNKVSCCALKQSVAKLLPTRQLTNIWPRIKFLNAITAFIPLTVFLIKSFATNKMYLHEDHSGFETESPVYNRN